MIQSRLKWTVVPLILITVVIAVLITVSTITIKTAFTPVNGGVMLLILMSFSLWMLLYQIRVQTQEIVIQRNSLSVKNWAGLGSEKQYDITKLSGFHSSTLSSRAGNFKAVYIMDGKSKIAWISEFSHSNFDEINDWATASLTHPGFVSTNVFSEIKDSFKH
jgi:hypothetical protein